MACPSLSRCSEGFVTNDWPRREWPNVAYRGGFGVGRGRGLERKTAKRDRNRRVTARLSPHSPSLRDPFFLPFLAPTPTNERAMTKIGVLRDIKARKGVAANEIARRAYLYVARNQTLPPQVRYQAQLQLNTFGKYTRPTTVKNRCTESGRGRGIMSEFGLCRVRVLVSLCSLRLMLTCILRILVPVQVECLTGSDTRSEEGLLVIP